MILYLSIRNSVIMHDVILLTTMRSGCVCVMLQVDREMRKAGLIRDHPKLVKRIALSDKVENYKTMDKTVGFMFT